MTHKPQTSITSKATQKASEVANDISDAAANRAKSEASVARDAAAEETEKVANAAHAAAGEFDNNSMQAQAIEGVARQVDDWADQIRATDVDRLAHMVADTARRNPLMFVAGAALAGFAATRFLKARNPDHMPRTENFSDPWHSEPGPVGSASPVNSGLHEGA